MPVAVQEITDGEVVFKCPDCEAEQHAVLRRAQRHTCNCGTKFEIHAAVAKRLTS